MGEFADALLGDDDEDEDIDPVEDARALAAGTPRPLTANTQSFDELPLGDRLGTAIKGTPLESVGSFFENVGGTFMGNTADELAALTSFGGPDHGPDTRYAAGSRYEDNRRTMEADKEARDRENPWASTGGKITGGVIQGAALSAVAPIAKAAQLAKAAQAAKGTAAAAGASTAARIAAAEALLAETGLGAGATAASMLGEGQGDLGNRTEQAWEAAKEHPILTTASVAAPAVAAGVARGGREVAKKFNDLSYENTVAAFASPQQRAAIIANHGDEGVRKLGKDVRELGIHKQPWWAALAPPGARTFYNNARNVRERGLQKLTEGEAQILAAGDPKIDVEGVAQYLDDSASDVAKKWGDPKAAANEAKFRSEQAAGMRKGITEPLQGPRTAREIPPDPEALAQHQRELHKYNRLTQLPDPPQVGPEVDPAAWAQYTAAMKALKPGDVLPPAPNIIEPPALTPTSREIARHRAEVEAALKKQAELPEPVAPEVAPEKLAAHEKALAKHKVKTTVPEMPGITRFEGPSELGVEGKQQAWDEFVASIKNQKPGEALPPMPKSNDPLTVYPAASKLEAWKKQRDLALEAQAGKAPAAPTVPKTKLAAHEKARKQWQAETAMPEPPAAPPDVDPTEWAAYVDKVKQLKPGEPLPAAPNIIKPSVPDTPTAKAIREHRSATESALTHQAENAPPKAPESTWIEGPELGSVPRDVGFTEAQDNLRYLNKEINYSGRGGYEGAPMQEQVRREAAAKLLHNLEQGVDDAVGSGQLTEDTAKLWRTGKKEYGTASAVEDPALMKMQSEYGGGMGLKDIAGASLLNAMGAPGLVSAGTAKFMHGRWPGFIANQQAHTAKTASGVAAVAGNKPAVNVAREALRPSVEEARQQNPDGTRAQVEASANDIVKSKMAEAAKEAARQGKNWWDILFGE